MSRPLVEYVPESETDLHVFKAHWQADNGIETAVFVTEDEAVKFARNRWGREPVIDRSKVPASGRST